MRLSPSPEQQLEMRHAYYDGAPGIMVSGLVWIAAALALMQFGIRQAVWTLLIGGALIHPVSIMLIKSMGRPATTAKTNALKQLGMASTIWLIVCCAMCYGLFLSQPTLFFPAMMAIIGCRYLVFASIYGRAIFWLLGAALLAGANLCYFMAVTPVLAASLGGLIELLFACLVMPKRAPRTS